MALGLRYSKPETKRVQPAVYTLHGDFNVKIHTSYSDPQLRTLLL